MPILCDTITSEGGQEYTLIVEETECDSNSGQQSIHTQLDNKGISEGKEKAEKKQPNSNLGQH